MGIFRYRDRTPLGWTSYAPLADAPAWQPASLRSPIPDTGHAVLRQREGEITRLSSQERARRSDRFQQVDLRRRLIQIHPQSIPTADAMKVTITLALSVRTTDPVSFISDSQQPDHEIYLAAQIALRELVATLPLETFTGARIDLSPILEEVQPAASAVGVTVETVLLKDISLPTEYASALQEALVSKIRSETDLERARSEVKTTRARLASAKVLEQNPVLARIRMIEALPPGSTIEVRGEQG